jgi:HAD superfamily hydrolase (TIGR01509 family)
VVRRHFDAVLFDFGDTLFYRAGGPARLVELAEAAGVDVSHDGAQAIWDQVQLEARTPEAMAKGRDLSREAHDREWLALYSAFDALGPGLGAAMYEHEMSPGGWVPFPDTRPTLEALRAAGVKIGVVSNAGWDVRIQFVAAGIHDLVDAYALSYEVGVIKPDPELFRRPCQELGVEPGRVVMVGDTPIPDGGAVAAGIATYLLPLAMPDGPRGIGAVVRLVGAGTGTVAAS